MPFRVPRLLQSQSKFWRTAGASKNVKPTRGLLSAHNNSSGRGSGGRMSSGSGPANIKKNLIRLILFAAIALVLVQIGLAGDPVQMYLQTVGDATSPAMDFSEDSIPVGGQENDMWMETMTSPDNSLPTEAQSLQSGQIFLRAIPPQEGIRVWQDNKCLGEISSTGKTFSVKPGRVMLEADTRDNAQKIYVEIFYLGKKYTLYLEQGKASFDVNR